MNYLTPIASAVMAWDHMTQAPHRYNAVEFNLTVHKQTIEIGHLHGGTMLDILYSMAIRDVLITEGRAQEHHILPDTGWITYHVRQPDDVDQALWLLRLSYLQKLYRATRGRSDFDYMGEIDQLALSDMLFQAAFPQLIKAHDS